MIPDGVTLPERSSELSDLEARYSRLRRLSRETQTKLQAVETVISRSLMTESGDLDEIAGKLATGEISDFKQGDLPLQRHDLMQRLEAFRKSEALLFPDLQRLRQKHANQIAAAIRPRQREAVKAIDEALAALLAAIDAERAAHLVVPGAPLVACSFPGINEERVKAWRGYAIRNGLLPDPKAEPAPATRRSLFAGRKANGAAEPAPALVALERE